ncbi:MAG TPA: IPT/TIG domain-containing protein, partial [Pyrinomonadaceae bacterium]
LDQRLIFLELPMSLYSVPKKDDDYVVQLKWNVLRFFGPNQGAVDKIIGDGAGEQQEQTRPVTLDVINNVEALKGRITDSEFKEQYGTLDKMGWAAAAPSKFRVLDIIPRQSALNINDQHATQKGLALTAKFLSVFGFGGQVGYQRQRSVYEQFIQQEVYASAFGKGLSNFGWTFGPLPGTRRLAPGVRTTYAILAIPRDVLALELRVGAHVFKRNAVPGDAAAVKPLPQVDEGFGAGTFRILVPSERTEGFWVNSVTYTPVKADQYATVIIKGDYFSPLTGVLVNGVPLKRVVSIGKNESDASTLPRAINAFGEYEYLNANELILSLKMSSGYSGTPIITLVTPEKTSSINFFKLDNVNFHFKDQSLADVSKVEPMFLEAFDVTGVEPVEEADAAYVRVNLVGKGLRRSAQVFVNNEELVDGQQGAEVRHVNTGLYSLRFKRPPEGRPAVITYRNTTRQGVEQESLTFQQNVVSNYEILRYDPAPAAGPAALDVVLTISGQSAAPRVSVDPRDGEVLSQPEPLGGDRYRLRLLAKSDPLPLSVTNVAGVTRIFDIGLPSAPTVDAVVNTATGKAEGPAAKAAVVTLRGSNFQHVVRVLFGNKEATVMQVDPQVILVNAPTGEEGAVQVLLETNVRYRGKTVSNIADFRTQGKSVYTYTK